MSTAKLNLTRKWRSKNFKEIVGQSLVVRILQNSLYLKQFFPVYLFAGQRGCGKTSTARVFAAAVNCESLSDFQKNPRSTAVPCLKCQSCSAMSEGKHPDFIEIDAASYTGVDNVRNIIDASSFLPILGNKKIYLIDEAHMLSKAAFNAFLKILEEPPATVLFILATTDMHKILETVKSRCFQVFFDPVDQDKIVKHLQNVCEKEEINADDSGLKVIAQESQGSVRDAINLLEQVRFSVKKVDEQSVLNVLGHIDEATLSILLGKILDKNIVDFLIFAKSLDKYSLAIDYVWKKLIEITYDAILIHYEVAPRQFTDLSDELINKIKKSDLNFLLHLFELLSSQEKMLEKTTKKQLLLEMELVQFLSQVSGDAVKKKNKRFVNIAVDTKDLLWGNFLELIDGVHDVVLSSIFQEAHVTQFSEDDKTLQVSFLKKFFVFKETLEEQKIIWLPLLEKVYGKGIVLNFTFDFVKQENIAIKETVKKQKIEIKEYQKPSVKGKAIDISDKEKWKLAHELVKYFDGIISEISGDIYE